MIGGDTNRVPSFRTPERIPELDGLRGVAIGLVVITHCLNFVARPDEPKYLAHLLAFASSAKSFAWSGVDLFFVLSGFLIGGKLLDTRRSPDYFKTFYARRALRILPAYFIFLSLMAFAYAFIYPSHRLAMAWPLDHPLPWYFYLTFTANIWMAYHNTYGAWGLAVLWSLAVEEQFYLIAPFLVRFVRPARLPHVFATGIVSALLLRCSLQLIRVPARMALYVLLPCRVDALLWGMLAACSLRRPRIWNFLVEHANWLWRFFFVLGAGICLASFSSRMTIHSVAITTVGFDWLDVFYLTALVLVLADRQSWLAILARRPWLMGLGTVSYSLYLIHYSIYGLSMGYVLQHSGPVRSLADLSVALFAVALAIGLATLSWHFVEKPIMSGGFSVQLFSTHSGHLKAHWQKADDGAPTCDPHYGALLGLTMEDRGVQYTSNDRTGLSRTFRSAIRMSRQADLYDNAIAEVFVKTQKDEGVYRDPAEAHASIGRFLEQVYNRKQFALRAAQRAAARSLAAASAMRECA